MTTAEMASDPLPYVFAGLMAVSVFAYVVLDGFDLGVGLLSRSVTDEERNVLISSIGPFWDANETWLVLAVGLLLVAFPEAHGIVLSALYVPVVIMLLGLTLRGVAFEFRAKVPPARKPLWDGAFFWGSFLTAVSQGYMLGAYVLGFADGIAALGFAVVSAVGVAAAYALIGAAWLIAKTQGELQKKAIAMASKLVLGTAMGLLAVSVVTPIVSERVRTIWFSFPEVILFAPIPIMTVLALWALHVCLKHLKTATTDRYRWLPFSLTVAIFALSFFGLAVSFLPWIVPYQVKIIDAASSRESLKIILAGTLFTLPMIIGYTVLSYRVFRGKAKPLAYS
jgi:cytochrome d ubiquinol oxidase subunit II